MTSAVCEEGTFTMYLSGFSQALNWKATEFVNPLHRVRVCSLCGVVPHGTYALECCHVFCKTCYDSIAGCEQVCPIDGTSFDDTRVTSLKFPETDLLKRKVRCWNKDRGCTFTGSLADTLSHFHEGCTFHQVRCLRCHRPALQRDMLDHYMQDCMGGSSEEEPGTASLANAILKNTKEVEVILACLADAQVSLQDSLNNLTAETRGRWQSIEKSIDGQTRELVQVRQKQEEFSRFSSKAFDDIQASMTRVPGSIRHQHWLKKKLNPVFKESDDKVYWSVENLSYHIECGRNATEEQVVSEPFAIAGYTARLCVKFVKADDDINVEIFFHLCRGPKDGELDWPFIIPFILSLVHPRDASKDSRMPFDPLDVSFSEAFQRPTTAYNGGVGGSCFAKASALDKFVLNDAILVCLQLICSTEAFHLPVPRECGLS